MSAHRHRWALSARPDVLECADCGVTCAAVNLKRAIREARWLLRGGASFDRVAFVYGRAVAQVAMDWSAPRPAATSDRRGR